MGFSMRACRDFSLALGVLLALHAAGSAADFRVTEISAHSAKGGLNVSGVLELVFTAKVEEALSKGIPLVVNIELRLYRRSPVLWNQHLQSWVLHRRISYHALSRQYLVSGLRADPEVLESFTSLQTASVNMGLLDEVQLPLGVTLDAEHRYYLRLRANLDLEALPAPLRPVAYTSLSWRLNSGWTEWNVQH